MDIIASHRQGLIEQFEVEAAALAGGLRDSVQRAITCHHVADMLGGAHGYALLAGEAALALDVALERLARRAARWSWRSSRAKRATLCERVAAFADTLRRLDAERCAALLMAYRLVATPGLGGEAEQGLGGDLLASLKAVQSAEGRADRASRNALFAAHAGDAERRLGARLEEAVAALDWPHAPAALDAAIAGLLIPAGHHERAEQVGLARVERRLCRSKRLPAQFAANPAQAFFKLQREIIERRRRAADGDHLSPDDAVRQAA